MTGSRSGTGVPLNMRGRDSMIPRIILLEDDELVRMALTRALLRRGFEVVSSPDPSICPVFRKFQSGGLGEKVLGDFLLTDNNMPFLNGLDLIAMQVEQGGRGGIRNKAVMSAAWDDDDLEKATRFGCQIFHKPLNIAEVYSWLERGKQSLRADRELVSL